MAFFLLLGVCGLAIAQTPPGEEPGASPETLENPAPCIPASETDSPGDDQGDGESSSEPCVEPSPETFPEEEPFLSEEPAVMEDDASEIEGEFGSAIEENILPTEASVEEEFKPGDEISEDYPVPLPSDI